MEAEERVKASTLTFKKIEERIQAIPDEITLTEKREEEVKKDLDKILKDIENNRNERQRALVSGGKVDPISQRIEGLWKVCDITEDLILGLQTKVKELHVEKEKLLKDKDLCRDEIIKTSLIPLKERYNKEAEALSTTEKEILCLMDSYDLSFGEGGWGRFISPSSWIGLRIIPRLSLQGETVGEDFVNLAKIYTERGQEQIERSMEKVRDAKKAK
jgi:hypothetical protein